MLLSDPKLIANPLFKHFGGLFGTAMKAKGVRPLVVCRALRAGGRRGVIHVGADNGSAAILLHHQGTAAMVSLAYIAVMRTSVE